MEKIRFRKLGEEDFALLHEWMQVRHVHNWWGEGKNWSFEDIKKKYGPYVSGSKPIFPFIIEYHGHPVGYIQYYNAFDFSREGFAVDDVWKGKSLASLDFFIGDVDMLGKGFGSEALEMFLEEHVFKHFDACLVDPDKHNKSALKSYAKAGFTTLKDFDKCVLMIASKHEQRNPLIIQGSSRGDGNTHKAVQTVIQGHSVPVVDLGDLQISIYDYNYKNRHDDFLSLAERMVQHNPIVLATPVYWYTMSATMKTFVDRWSDLLDIRKDIGRRLTNKEMYVIASYGTNVPRGFEDAFAQTCDYMEMTYKGCLFFYSGDEMELKKANEILAKEFFTQIMEGK